jgi:hypothetical protein|tara:strand:- start:1448 stop:1675 length:228 start_codon:yes stop_codon:yes gene_type:complete
MNEYEWKFNLSSILEAKDMNDAKRQIIEHLRSLDNLMDYIEIEQVETRSYEEILEDEEDIRLESKGWKKRDEDNV